MTLGSKDNIKKLSLGTDKRENIRNDFLERERETEHK